MSSLASNGCGTIGIDPTELTKPVSENDDSEPPGEQLPIASGGLQDLASSGGQKSAAGGEGSGGAKSLPAMGGAIDDVGVGGADIDNSGGSASGGEGVGGASSGGTSSETTTDCSTGEFSAPIHIATLGVEGEKWSPSLSGDNLSLYFARSNETGEVIYRATRPDRESEFSKATIVEDLHTSLWQGTPFINYDETRLYFIIQTTEDQRTRDIWVASRSSKADPFLNSRPLEGINTDSREHLPWLSRDELTIYYTSAQVGSDWITDLWSAQRTEIDGEFTNARQLLNLDSEYEDGSPTLSPDGRTIYFMSDRPAPGPTNETFNIWSATRATTSAAFSEPQLEAGLSSDKNDLNLSLSSDGRELFISSNRATNDPPNSGTSQEIWVARRDCAPFQGGPGGTRFR